MPPFLNTLIQICLFRAKPQDLPASTNALATTALGMFVALMITDNIRGSDANVFITSLFQVALLALALRIVVALFAKPERWMQCATAVLGCNTVIMILVIPLFAMAMSQDPEDTSSLLRLGILATMIWALIIRVVILRETLEVASPVAFVIALVLELGIFVILFTIFGNQIL